MDYDEYYNDDEEDYYNDEQNDYNDNSRFGDDPFGDDPFGENSIDEPSMEDIFGRRQRRDDDDEYKVGFNQFDQLGLADENDLHLGTMGPQGGIMRDIQRKVDLMYLDPRSRFQEAVRGYLNELDLGTLTPNERAVLVLRTESIPMVSLKNPLAYVLGGYLATFLPSDLNNMSLTATLKRKKSEINRMLNDQTQWPTVIRYTQYHYDKSNRE